MPCAEGGFGVFGGIAVGQSAVLAGLRRRATVSLAVALALLDAAMAALELAMRQVERKIAKSLAVLALALALGTLSVAEGTAAEAVGAEKSGSAAKAEKKPAPVAKVESKAAAADKSNKGAAKEAEKTTDKQGDKARGKDAVDKPAIVGAPEQVEATPVGEDAAKLGPFQAPPRAFPFPLLGDDRAREVFVDRAGNLYKERPYQGNVPDWNEAPSVALGGRCKVETQSLNWVGFQNNADGSRIYVQVEGNACGYVYRPDDLHIVIDLPQVGIPSENLKREILTGAFPTAVEMVKAEDLGGKGTRVVIVLRERRPYLSAHLGRYLFVDVTR